MKQQILSIPMDDQRKIVGAASPESALLYLFLAGGGDVADAEFTLRFSKPQLDIAIASLRQLGLYQEIKPSYVVGEPPRYTEQDVTFALSDRSDFPLLIGELQQRFGRIFSSEEVKTVLLFKNYLGLPTEVINILFTFCLNRNQQRGKNRPSFFEIQKEAYRWAEQGIDTLEEASGYMQTQMERQAQLKLLAHTLQISNRKLTLPEEKYLLSWLNMGFGQAEIQLVYEKSCLKTGSMSWGYCDSIMRDWSSQKLLTVADIQTYDRGPSKKAKVPMGTGNTQNYSDLERQAIEKLRRDFG